MNSIKYKYKTNGGTLATVTKYKDTFIVGLYDKVLPIEFSNLNDMEDFLLNLGYKKSLK